MAEENFAELVKRLRNERRWTQAQMAEAMGIELRAYAKYEYGETKEPGLSLLRKLIKGLDLDPAEAFGKQAPRGPSAADLIEFILAWKSADESDRELALKILKGDDAAAGREKVR